MKISVMHIISTVIQVTRLIAIVAQWSVFFIISKTKSAAGILRLNITSLLIKKLSSINYFSHP